jgi:hypothetical protein
LAALTIAVLLVLVWMAAVPKPYEQDQMSKAAKIIALAKAHNFINLAEGEDFYRDALFSFYYLTHALLHTLLQSDVFLEMNIAAAVAGALFFALTATLFHRVHRIPYWLTALLAVNTPMFMNVFCYGNEAAFALMAFAAVTLLLSEPSIGRCVMAGVIYALGLHCRPDFIFLGPFLCAWTYFQNEHGIIRERITQCALFFVVTGLTGGIYWLIFVHRLPGGLTFNLSFRWSIFVAYLVYPFGLILEPIAFIGFIRLLYTRCWRNLLLLGLICAPLAYYARMLSSPKYVAMLMLPVWALAGTMLLRWRWSLRACAAAASLALWICSVSPFGVFLGTRGAAWILPTDDGWIPTGSYASFYQRVHSGFLQDRYVHEMHEVSLLLEPLQRNPDPFILGFFDLQAEIYERARNPEFDKAWSKVLWQEKIQTNRTCLMIRTAYLRQNIFDAANQKTLRDWLAAGKLRALASTPGDPFPEVIEIGESIPAGQETELGQRIIFILDWSQHTAFNKRALFVPEWVATRWLPVKEAKLPWPPAYRDTAFLGFTNDIGEGVIYSGHMPPVYYKRDTGRDRFQN